MYPPRNVQLDGWKPLRSPNPFTTTPHPHPQKRRAHSLTLADRSFYAAPSSHQ